MELVGEDRFLIRLAVTISVFVNQELVIGDRVAGPVVRIGRHHRDPEPPLVIEGELHRIREIGELFFRSKQFDLISLGHGEGFLRRVTVEVFSAAVLRARLIVRRDRRKDVGLRIIHGEIGRFTRHDPADEIVAQRRHLAHFFDFVRIILRTERIVALPVGVDAVEDVVVAVPEPVLLLHRGVDGRRIRL